MKVKLWFQVIFHARKKLHLQRLKELAAARTADQLLSLGAAEQLAAEGLIPAALVQDLILACLDTWTQRLTGTNINYSDHVISEKKSFLLLPLNSLSFNIFL